MNYLSKNKYNKNIVAIVKNICSVRAYEKYVKDEVCQE